MFNVAGKVALVTGALGGIGRCITKTLLKNNVKGVALLDINEATAANFQNELQAEFGSDKTVFIKLDVAEPKQIEDAYQTAVQHYKQLDIVVNNVGIGEGDVLKCMQTNYVATAFSTHLALRKYLEAYRNGDEAVIVNVASVAGICPFPFLPVYASTKHGVVTLGRSFGHKCHYNSRKVKVLTVCPAQTNTAMLDEYHQLPDDIKEMALKAIKKVVPQSPENVGNAVLDVIRNAKSGSVWIVKHDKPAEEIDFSEVDKLMYKHII